MQLFKIILLTSLVVKDNFPSELNLTQFSHKNQRGIKSNCQLCNANFTPFKKEHVCKRCLRSVCSECSPLRVKTYEANRNNQLHRNCLSCNIESKLILKYIQDNSLKWGQDSHLLYVWSKILQNRKFVRTNTQQPNLINLVSLDNLWRSFNYSLREFVSIIIQKDGINDLALIQVINEGINQIYYFFPEKLQEAIYLFIYFMCHCKLKTALSLTIVLIDIVQKSQINKFNFQNLLCKIGFSSVQVFKIYEFVVDNEYIFKSNASLNVMPVNVSFHIINFILINNNAQYLWRGIFYSFYQRKQTVIQNITKPNVVILDLLRNASKIDLINGMNVMSNIPLFVQYTRKIKTLAQQFEISKTENERMSKQLSQLKKISYQIQTQDSTQKSTKLNLQNILLLKNSEVIKMKAKYSETLTLYYNQKAQNNKLQEQMKTKNSQLKQKDTKLLIKQNENKQLKVQNKLLLSKIEQLSILLMDMQSQLKNKEQINSIFESISDEKNNKPNCLIY